jgi:hypothetical protein
MLIPDESRKVSPRRSIDDVGASRIEQFLDGGADVAGDSEVQLARQPHDPAASIGADVADELGGWSSLLH